MGADSVTRRSSLLHPFPIPLVHWIGGGSPPALLFIPIKPSMGFGMSIRKREAATDIVIGSRNVEPLGLFHAKGKGRVVESVAMRSGGILIQKNPEHGRSRSVNIGCFAKCVPR